MSTSLVPCLLVAVMILCVSHAARTRSDDGLPPMFGGRIKHVIAIMLENRSFDHMLGYQRAHRRNIDGCLPSLGEACANPLDPTVANSTLIYVNDEAVNIQPGDPDHSISGTSLQAYNVFADNQASYYPPPMNGFVKSYADIDADSLHDDGAIIMQCFNQSTLPILNTLAEEFAVIDRWFADVPGPTDPNRLFAMMATSQGMGTDDHTRLAEGFIGPNVFHMMDEAGPDGLPHTSTQKWRTYFEQTPTSAFLNYVRTHAEHARDLHALFRDLENGTLPLFSWIDPAYFDIDELNMARDQHPDHDIAKGEQLLKDLYEHLRKSPRWNDTLLVVLYDEHGGFFDHVPPPNAPNPDGKNATDVSPPFMFNRLGLRVPAILVSPWIGKGTVAKRPNHDEAQYCHSSLVKTLREQFAPSYPVLTQREAWSQSFEHLVSLDKPRTDCPTRLPEVPRSTSGYDKITWRPGQQSNSEFQISLAKAAAVMCGKHDELHQYTQTQASLGKFVMQCMAEWMK